MTEHPVHYERFNRRTADPFASRLLARGLIAGGMLVSALIGATFGATFVAPHFGSAHFGSEHKALVDSSGSATAPAVEPMKIVPADALDKSVSWSPRTGDGSN
jgi:hypothetical protein